MRFRPAGHSMHPTIRDGEVLLVEPVVCADVHRGDVVLYRTGERVIAHRVVRVEGGESIGYSFTLRGDACRSSDEPVSAEQVLGRVVAIERGGRVLTLSRRPQNLRRVARRAASRCNLLFTAIFRPRKHLRML